ncbi:MAG: methylisocitrate lyase [Flavobacteriaceae bacterium]|jgi:methylisocitrate lyase|nr:methylisocitrate lyase [Flavobacteriaceae bacterium]|tara:strand:- start:1275 stop:2135 length:861 start_codon:yes stop_codon:yes gene_type:complete
MSKNFFDLLEKTKPLKVVGAVNAYNALLAEKSGLEALYLSGAGVANASYGIPDLAMTSKDNVLEDLRRIKGVSELPVLVDCDTGWGSALSISKTTKDMISAGASGIHIEDQVSSKRCGHRPNKEIVSKEEMVDRIKASKDSAENDFLLMARTDAFAKEGISGVIERCSAYVEAGANSIFPEAIVTLEDYSKLASNLKVPILANITEFGLTPLFNDKELGDSGVDIILHPLSAFRAMSKAAEEIYLEISSKGSVEKKLEIMQSRDELYDVLNYHTYEQKIDNLFSKD